MVGGVVIGLIYRNDVTVVHVRGMGSDRHKSTCINAIDERQIRIGDFVRWGQGEALWTPMLEDGRSDKSRPIKKIGIAHSTSIAIE